MSLPEFLHVDTATSSVTLKQPWSRGLHRDPEDGALLSTHKQAGDSCYFGFQAKKGKSQHDGWMAVSQTSSFRLNGKLQPCPIMGLMDCCAACSLTRSRATSGLKHALYHRSLWQSCSWLIRDVPSLSHHAIHQIQLPFTILASYALCSSCSA